MSVNRERPHVYVLPEDHKNSQIALGFISHLEVVSVSRQHQVQLMPCLRGWESVCEKFKKVYAPKVNKNANCHVVMLIDFDQRSDRRDTVDAYIPAQLKDRVFVVGLWSEPEKMTALTKLTSYQIGSKSAERCPGPPSEIWNHPLMKHNANEVIRIWKTLGPILFPS